MKARTQILAAFIVGVGFGHLTLAEEADKGEVLATVNGAAIYAKDLYDPASLTEMPEESRKEFIDQRLQQAIETELLYQEGVKQGLDKDPDYLKAVEAQKKMMAQREIEMAASYYEQQVESLKTARDRNAITDEEIATYYQENIQRYKGRSEERAGRIIRSQLANMRYREAYAAWLKTITASVPVKVNGKVIAADVINQAVDRNMGVNTAATQPAPDEADPLWAAVAAAAGLTLPADLSTAEPAATKDLRAKLLDLTILVGTTEMNTGSLYQLQQLESEDAQLRLGPELFYVLKSYIVREKAIAEGIDKTPEFIAQMEQAKTYEGGGMMGAGSPEKQLLVNRIITEKGFYNIDDYKVEEAQIDAYYAEHGKRYERLEQRPNGKERVRRMIERILKSQMAEEKKKGFIDEIRASAKVEIP